MKKEYLNIEKIENLKTLVHAAWLFDHRSPKDTEIVLQTSDESFKQNSPLLLRAIFIAITEGIKNHGAAEKSRRKDFDYNSVTLTNYLDLTKALSATTGFRFSIEVTE